MLSYRILLLALTWAPVLEQNMNIVIRILQDFNFWGQPFNIGSIYFWRQIGGP